MLLQFAIFVGINLQQGDSFSSLTPTSVPIGRLDRVIDPLITDTETSFSVMQAKLLYQHYRNLFQSQRWRALPEGVKPLRLVWDCTDIPPESAWRYIPTLVAPETVMMLEPSTLLRYREVSLLPVRLTEDEQAEQHVTNGLSEISLDERVDQLVNEEMARCSKGAAQRAISFAAAPWAIAGRVSTVARHD